MSGYLQTKFITIFSILLLAAILYTQLGKHSLFFDTELEPIRIGILHSLTGTMAESETPLVEILIMGVNEINAKGGLLGRQVEVIIVDGRSDWKRVADEAERLIRDEKVDVIFGCWTSACRKEIKPIIEKYNHLLFYALQYEGLETSGNIVYTGAIPNQQIIPGVNWALKNLGERVYLLGSDYIFPWASNIIIRDIVEIKNAEVVAERYVSLGSSEFDEIISEIESLQPDVIFNTINGDSNKSFFQKRNAAGLDKIPVVSFSISEVELAGISSARVKTHYAVWSYFQSIKNNVNSDFVGRVKKHFGDKHVVGDAMEASYIGLKLWSKAVLHAESVVPSLVLRAINEQSFNAPEGIVSVDSVNHHLRKFVRIGQAREDGQFDIVWKSGFSVRPVPFPTYRSKSEWQKIIKERLNGGEK